MESYSTEELCDIVRMTIDRIGFDTKRLNPALQDRLTVAGSPKPTKAQINRMLTSLTEQCYLVRVVSGKSAYYACTKEQADFLMNKIYQKAGLLESLL